MSCRTPTDGHGSPRMCSLRASPLPTPSTKRPSSCTAAVAAAWAMIAGWMRTVGQVTPVVTGSDVDLRQRPDHAPHERALALRVVPRVEVVGDPQPLEAGLLGAAGLVDQLRGTELLAGQEVADACHVGSVPDLEDLTPASRQVATAAAGWSAATHRQQVLGDHPDRPPPVVAAPHHRQLARRQVRHRPADDVVAAVDRGVARRRAAPHRSPEATASNASSAVAASAPTGPGWRGGRRQPELAHRAGRGGQRDERLGGQLGEGHDRSVVRRRWPTGSATHRCSVAATRWAMPGTGDRQPGDGHVDRPVVQADRRVAPGHLAEPQPPAGQPFLQRGGDRRDQAAADAGVEADDERPPDGLGGRRDVGDGAAPTPPTIRRAGASSAAPASVSAMLRCPRVNSSASQPRLQGAHLLRQRRLGDEQHVPRPG